MARLLAVSLGCILLLYLSLPGTMSRRQGGSRRLALPREPPVRTPSGGLQPQLPTPRPVVWKPRQALLPQWNASLATAMGQPIRNGPRRHLGPRRPRAQFLRAGCVLGTCQAARPPAWPLVSSPRPWAAFPSGGWTVDLTTSHHCAIASGHRPGSNHHPSCPLAPELQALSQPPT
ncbi:protein ADM2 isoform X1 [Rhinolophus sinicus]|uniref:protein ADM2 isoform X1 n=1 Tax=Rhinolophus sinicus TaxID=89399 RepID=UPI003D7953E2